MKRAFSVSQSGQVSEIELPPLPPNLPAVQSGSYTPDDPTALDTPITRLPEELLLDCLARFDRGSIGPAMRVCKSWRDILQSETFRIYREHLGLTENRLFVLATTQAANSHVIIQMFRPDKNSWAHIRYQDSSISIDDFSQASAINESIFVLSGVLAKDHAPVVYHPWTNCFRSIKGLNVPRYKTVCGEINGQLFAGGGLRARSCSGEREIEEGGKDLKGGEVYSPELDLWDVFPSMQKERCGGVGGCVDGKLYIIGGTKNNQQFRADAMNQSMEIYDPISRTWELKEPIPKLGLILASVVFHSSIYIMRNEGSKISWIKYSTRKDKWKVLHDMPGIPHDPMLLNKVGFKCVAGRNRIFIVQVRGCYGDINPQATSGKDQPVMLVYNPKAEGSTAYKKAAEMPVVTSGAVCVMVRC